MDRPDVSIVVASIDARGTARASLSALLDEAGESGDVLFVDASRDATLGAIVEMADLPRLRVLSRKAGLLVPQLWAEGLCASRAPLVAFTTAQMIPRAGWLAALRRTMTESGAAAVGGPIAPAAGLRPTDGALYLLRYASYLPPVPSSARFDPPGDNALYRRDALIGLDDAWRDGFWEATINRLLRARGESLTTAPDAILDYHGGSTLGSALRQRFAHARHYGAGRWPDSHRLRRLLHSAAFAAIPPLLLSRIVRSLRLRGEPLARWAPALPQLALLLSAWSAGEATGSLRGLGIPRQA